MGRKRRRFWVRRRERGGLGAGERRSRRRFGEREREAEAPGLEILRVLKGLIDGKMVV